MKRVEPGEAARSGRAADVSDRHGRIDIRFGAARNKRADSGWLPVVTNNDRHTLDSWRVSGYDRAEALARAEQLAHEEAARYVGGDWEISVLADTEP